MTTKEQQEANRLAYRKYSLELWRRTITQRVEDAKTCKHVWGWVGGIEACTKCCQTKKVAEIEDV